MQFSFAFACLGVVLINHDWCVQTNIFAIDEITQKYQISISAYPFTNDGLVSDMHCPGCKFI